MYCVGGGGGRGSGGGGGGGGQEQWDCGKSGTLNFQRVGSIVRDIGDPCLSHSHIKVVSCYSCKPLSNLNFFFFLFLFIYVLLLLLFFFLSFRFHLLCFFQCVSAFTLLLCLN